MIFLLLTEGQYALFAMLLIAIVISLSFHEFGHAFVAKTQGDDTAQRMGRLTVNPLAHLDWMGLAMVVFVGFGYAKPVPTDPRNFRSRYSTLFVAAAGPEVNLLLAFVCANLLALMMSAGVQNPGAVYFLQILATINLLLMLFNLLPIGPLDGHYILPYFLPRQMAVGYLQLNARYGVFALLALVALAIMGVPVFTALFDFAQVLLRWLVVI